MTIVVGCMDAAVGQGRLGNTLNKGFRLPYGAIPPHLSK